jgi:hypothetical protein
MTHKFLGLGLVVGAALLGCGAKNTTVFDQYGYLHKTYAYRVLRDPAVANSATDALLDQDWLYDNLFLKRSMDGKSMVLKPKETRDYLTTYGFDTDGNGSVDRKEQAFVYDLRFKHRLRDSSIFVRTIPIGGDLRDKELRVLVQRYIDESSGAGYEAVNFAGRVVVTEQRFAAELRERGDATLAGQPAYQATFDIANVDQLRVSPNARRTRVRIVFSRAPFEHAVQKEKFPVLLVAGYASLPEDFDKDLPSFNKLLGHIQIGAKLGYSVGPQEQLAAPPAPVAPPPALVAPPPTPAAAAPALAATPSAPSVATPPAPSAMAPPAAASSAAAPSSGKSPAAPATK